MAERTLKSHKIRINLKIKLLILKTSPKNPKKSSRMSQVVFPRGRVKLIIKQVHRMVHKMKIVMKMNLNLTNLALRKIRKKVTNMNKMIKISTLQVEKVLKNKRNLEKTGNMKMTQMTLMSH